MIIKICFGIIIFLALLITTIKISPWTFLILTFPTICFLLFFVASYKGYISIENNHMINFCIISSLYNIIALLIISFSPEDVIKTNHFFFSSISFEFLSDLLKNKLFLLFILCLGLFIIIIPVINSLISFFSILKNIPFSIYLHYLIALICFILFLIFFEKIEYNLKLQERFNPDKKTSILYYTIFLLIPAFSLSMSIFIITGSLMQSSYTYKDFLKKANFKSLNPKEKKEQKKESLQKEYTLTDFIKDKRKNLKIGFVLAGGGAKGSYQAGALVAIKDFLIEELRKYNTEITEEDFYKLIKFVSGTSIGSWNASFVVNRKIDKLENWWKTQIDIGKLFAPELYLPFVGENPGIINTTPWHKEFDDQFKEFNVENNINYYFTRTNSKKGYLEIGTNNDKLTEYFESEQVTEITNKDELRDSIFSSMTLPPIIPYVAGANDKFFEDGGVLDNLPIQFALLEKDMYELSFKLEESHEESLKNKKFPSLSPQDKKAFEEKIGAFSENTKLEEKEKDFWTFTIQDKIFSLKKEQNKINIYDNSELLLFVIPLNASFETEKLPTDMTTRLLRVLDVRQGALERRSLELLDLYNQLQLNKGQEIIYSVVICPKPPLIVDTMEFWKKKEIKEAFEFMKDSVISELKKTKVSESVEMIKIQQGNGAIDREVIKSPFRKLTKK